MHTLSVLSLCGLAVALTALPSAHAVPKYAKVIPNGSGVAGVTAVGHTDPDSGGGLNAFGKAFAGAGNAWTEALCKADSDGDGQTNGEELGDPCCVWKAGGTPAVAAGAKDPGSAASKLDDATLTKSRALCKAAEAPAEAPAASSAAPAAPGTVKPADGATNETPALTPGAPAATTAAPAPGAAATPAAPTAPAAPGAASTTTDGSDEYDWVPMDQMKNSSSSSSTAAKTPSATSSSSSSTNSSNANTTSAALPSVLSTRGSLVQVVAAAVVGVIALAL